MRVFSFQEFLKSGGDPDVRKFSLNNAYQRQAWVYACVNRIATSATNASLTFYRGNSSPAIIKPKNDEPITSRKSPIIQLFHPPYEGVIPSLKELIRFTFIYLCLHGHLFWVYERERGVPRNIKVMRKNQLEPLFSDPYDPYTLVGWLERRPDGSERRYKKSDVLHICYFDPTDLWGGMSPLTAAAMALQSEHAIAAWNAAFFKSGMKTPMVITHKKRLLPEKRKELRKEIHDFYSGVEGGQSVFLVDDGATAQPIKIEAKDVDFINGRKLNREEICAVYGVPPALVGIFEYSNYSNVREQIRIFWENTLIPQLTAIRDLVQVNVLDREFSGIYCDWDYSGVPGLNQEPLPLAQAVKTFRESGVPLEVIAEIVGEPRLIPDGWTPQPLGAGQSTGPKPGSGTGPSEPGAPQQEPAPPAKPPKPRDPKKPKKQLALQLLADFCGCCLVDGVELNPAVISSLWSDTVLAPLTIPEPPFSSPLHRAPHVLLRAVRATPRTGWSGLLEESLPLLADALARRGEKG